MGSKLIPTFLGIDGGGSKTRALLIDANASPISEGHATGSNPYNIGYAASAFHIDQAVQDALFNANPTNIEIASVFCGIAGIRNADEQSQLAKQLKFFSWARNARISIDHDLSIAYAAAFEDNPGIALICGTGSSCIGKDPSGNVIWTSGRHLGEDDPGSGYAIGLAAIQSGLVPQNPSEDRKTIAALAPQVIELATQGNRIARDILESNVNALVSQVRHVYSKLKLETIFSLGVIGGLGCADTFYRNLFLQRLASVFPDATPRFTNRSPVEAAARLALRQFSQ